MDLKELQNLIQEGEGQLIEFKESFKNIDKEICAFANANGGTLYIGITDSGKIKKTRLNNTLRSQIQSLNHSLEPPPSLEISASQNIIKIIVHESEDKPVKAPGGFYLRIGANSQKLSREEIFRFAIDESKIIFDEQLYIEESATSLLDIRLVEEFRQKAKLDIELDNLHLLENIRCLKRQNGIPYLTYAGIMFFTREPQKIFPQASITLLHMEDESTILDQKIIKGPLIHQVENAYRFVRERLKKRIIIQALRREEKLEIPEYVIRELIMNSIIHRDYFDKSSDVVIKIFDTYIEISNPGILHKGLSLETIYGRSYRRNALIADIFFHANYVERAGTGLLRIKKALKENKLKPLILSQEGLFFITKLIRSHETSLDIELTDRQKELFKMPDNFFPLSAQSYAKQFKISDRMARFDIKDLINKGLLKLKRQNRKVLYFKIDPLPQLLKRDPQEP